MKSIEKKISRQNPDTVISTKTELFYNVKKPEKHPQKFQFSEVIALAGNIGSSVAFSHPPAR
jgi:hypothetical protein